MFETKCNSNWSCSRARIVFGMRRRTKQAWRWQKNKQIVFDGWKNKNYHEFIWSKKNIVACCRKQGDLILEKLHVVRKLCKATFTSKSAVLCTVEIILLFKFAKFAL